jgi:hypothetical protein
MCLLRLNMPVEKEGSFLNSLWLFKTPTDVCSQWTDFHWLPCSVNGIRRKSHKFNLGSHQWHDTCVSLNTFPYQDSHIFSFLQQPTTHTHTASRALVGDAQMFDVRDRMFDSLLSSWYTTTRSTYTDRFTHIGSALSWFQLYTERKAIRAQALYIVIRR